MPTTGKSGHAQVWLPKCPFTSQDPDRQRPEDRPVQYNPMAWNQGRPQYFGYGGNAPLPPEAKKILKIWRGVMKKGNDQ